MNEYTTIKIKRSLINKCTIIAAENNIARKDLIESIIIDYLNQHEKSDGNK